MGVSFGGTAYVSYSRRDEEVHEVVSKLGAAFDQEWVDLKVDTNEVHERQSFDKFIEEIGEAECVVVIFSDNYFNSFFCMLELANMLHQGNATKRIYPIFAEADYRFDGSEQHWIQHWTDVKNDWFGEEPPADPNRVFGSEPECDFIIQQLSATTQVDGENESFFEQFGRLVAGTIPHSNDKLIEWVKDTYFERVRSSPFFDSSRNCHNQCSNLTKNSITNHLPDDIDSSAGEQVAYFSKLPLPELIEIFWQVSQKIKQEHIPDEIKRKSLFELSQLLRKLLPSLFCPSFLPKFRNQCEQEIGIIEIPHATMLSAELLMAGADNREANFYVRETPQRTQLYPGRFNLRLPPENGSKSPVSEIEDDLANQLGVAGKEVSDIFESCETHLASQFARLQPGRHYEAEGRRKLIKQRFSQMGRRNEPRYYWILLMGSDVSRQRWEGISRYIGETYPEIAILMLSADIDQEIEEDDLFDLLHEIIPANKPTSTNP